MQTIDLNGQWQLQYCRADSGRQSARDLSWDTIEAHVPGAVELDLMRAGHLPDITRGNHIYTGRLNLNRLSGNTVGSFVCLKLGMPMSLLN
jgi:hypothetical protein